MGKRNRRKAAKRKRAAPRQPGTPRQPRVFLETSGVIYDRHGHSLMQEAVRQAVGNCRVEVSNFIRMEYLRGVVVNLIELYFLIKESDSVSDALIDWSQKVNQERKLKIVLMSVSQWLVDQEDCRNQEKSLRRLGDLIVRLVYDFDDIFMRRTKDRLKCRLGRVKIPRRMFSEDMLLRFYERFKKIQRETPDCLLCRFKTTQQTQLTRCDIDLHGPAQQQKYSKYEGYVQQAQRLTLALASEETTPKCRWCERLGDTIIALHAPAQAIIVSADRAFVAFGDILKREVRLLPSLAELKKQLLAQDVPPSSEKS